MHRKLTCKHEAFTDQRPATNTMSVLLDKDVPGVRPFHRAVPSYDPPAAVSQSRVVQKL